MKENVIIEWNPPDYWETTFFDVLKSMENTHHHVLLPQEVHPYHFTKRKYQFVNLLVKSLNSKITFYTGGELNMEDFSHIDFIHWNSMIYEAREYFGDNQITKFTSMTIVKPGRQWRYDIFDKLYHSSINLSNIIFWFAPDCANDILNNQKLSPSLRSLILTNVRNVENIDMYSTEKQYHLGIFDIICETDSEHFLPTEKTNRAIFHRKPFLVFGCQYFHSKLEAQFGIKKFDIFDYSFDEIENNEQRMNRYIKEIKRINNLYSKEYILEKTLHTTMHNYLQFEKIKNIDYKPKYLNDLFWNSYK